MIGITEWQPAGINDVNFYSPKHNDTLILEAHRQHAITFTIVHYYHYGVLYFSSCIKCHGMTFLMN